MKGVSGRQGGGSGPLRWDISRESGATRGSPQATVSHLVTGNEGERTLVRCWDQR